MQAIASILLVPFMLLNFFGGIGSGIWLAILGEWWAIGYGVAGLFFSSMIIGIAMMPGLLFAAPAAILAEKGKLLLAFPLVLLSQLYTYSVVIAWCMLVFLFYMANVKPNSFWPLLIFSYGVALGPLMYMSQREQQSGSGEGAVMTTFFAQVAYVATSLLTAFMPITLLGAIIIFSGIMLVGMVFQIVIFMAIMIEQKRLGQLRLHDSLP